MVQEVQIRYGYGEGSADMVQEVQIWCRMCRNSVVGAARVQGMQLECRIYMVDCVKFIIPSAISQLSEIHI